MIFRICVSSSQLIPDQAPTAPHMHENKEAIRIAQAKLAPTARLIAGKVGCGAGSGGQKAS